jgi:carbamate kinase
MMGALARKGSVALVAFGGNAFKVDDGEYTIESQRDAAEKMCAELLTVIESGYDLVVTHGNGPQWAT